MSILFFLVILGFGLTLFAGALVWRYLRNGKQMAFPITRICSLVATGLGLFLGFPIVLNAVDGIPMILLTILLMPIIGSWAATLLFWVGRPREVPSQRDEIGLTTSP